MASKKKLKRKNKKLQYKLWEEKRQRAYTERDVKMWCEVILEQEEDLQRKDVMIAALSKENEKLKAPKMWINCDLVQAVDDGG